MNARHWAWKLFYNRVKRGLQSTPPGKSRGLKSRQQFWNCFFALARGHTHPKVPAFSSRAKPSESIGVPAKRMNREAYFGNSKTFAPTFGSRVNLW